jgi:4-amino-4-deoxy-L-arabinose transferase-like glycosyltransferase
VTLSALHAAEKKLEPSHYFDNIPLPSISIALVVAGLVLRILFLINYPIFQYSDALQYWNLAQSIAQNGTYLPTPDYTGGPYAYRPPGLPIILAVPMFLFGPQTWIVPALNLIIYLAVCFVGYQITLRLTDKVWATFSVGMLAFYPANIAVGSLSLTEPLTTLLLLSGLWAMLNLERWSAAILCGFFFGFAALTRPTFLVQGFLLIAYAIFQFFGKKPHIIKISVALIVFILTLMPWTVRNYVAFEEFVPGSTMGGVNFYMANNPAAHTGIDAMDQNLFEIYSDEIERGRNGYRLGLQWINDNKVDFFILSIKKFAAMGGQSSVIFNERVKMRCECEGYLYDILYFSDRIWWFLVWIVTPFFVARNLDEFVEFQQFNFMFTTIICLFLIHSIFIAIGRYHDPLMGYMVVILATALYNQFSRRSGHSGLS